MKTDTNTETNGDRGAADVDIVIPTHAEAPYVAEALDSVVAQTYSRWRVTVCENGPGHPGTAAAVARHRGDPRIRHLRGDELPKAENWTRAIRQGDAPYVAMLHEDDYWSPGFLEAHVAFLDAHPECGLVFSSMWDVDEQGAVVRERPHVVQGGAHLPRELVPVLLDDNVIGSPTPLVRRRAYESVGAAFSVDYVDCDWEMWLRIALRWPIGYLRTRDCSRRVHGASETSAGADWGGERLKILERFRELVERELPEAAPRATAWRRERSQAHLMCALQSAELCRRRAAIDHVRQAARERRAAALDPRTGAVLLTIALGPGGSRTLARLRGSRARSRETAARLVPRPPTTRKS